MDKKRSKQDNEKPAKQIQPDNQKRKASEPQANRKTSKLNDGARKTSNKPVGGPQKRKAAGADSNGGSSLSQPKNSKAEASPQSEQTMQEAFYHACFRDHTSDEDFQQTLSSLQLTREQLLELVNADLPVDSTHSHEGGSLLLVATERNQIALVRYLLEHFKDGINIKAQRNSTKTTALITACRLGYDEIIELLLESNLCDFYIKDQTNQSALMHAINSGHLNIAKKLIKSISVTIKLDAAPYSIHHERGLYNAFYEIIFDLNIQDSQTFKNLLETLFTPEQLLELVQAEYPESNKNSEIGGELLIVAAENNYIALMQYLLKNFRAYIDLNAGRGGDLETAFIAACSGGHVEAVQLLLKYGCDINYINHYDETPLMHTILAYGVNNPERKKQDLLQIASLLLKNGCNSSAVDSKGRSALQHAYERGNRDMIELFIQKNVDLNIKNKSGRTVLMLAVWDNKTEIVKQLLASEHCDPNIKDNTGRTALFYAIYNDSIASMPLLFARTDCDLNTRDNERSTALLYAVESGSVEPAKQLINNARCNLDLTYKPTQDPIFIRACIEGDPEIVAFLLATERCNALARNRHGHSALMAACRYGNAAVVNLLVAKLPTAELTYVDPRNRTPLMYAAGGDNTQTTIQRLLFEQPVVDSINQQGVDNKSAAWFCLPTGTDKPIANNRIESLALLLLAKADPNQQNWNGFTLAHKTAAIAGNSDKKLFLLLAGAKADLSVPNLAGKTAIHLAIAATANLDGPHTLFGAGVINRFIGFENFSLEQPVVPNDTAQSNSPSNLSSNP